MREADLRAPVEAWLLATEGTAVIHEYLLFGYGGYCDLLGVRFAPRTGWRIPELVRVTAVELKLEDVAGVLCQARNNREVVHASYAAMPEERCRRMLARTYKKFTDAGVGLLSIGATVRELINPGPPICQLNIEPFRKRWWRCIRRHEQLRRDAGRTPDE